MRIVLRHRQTGLFLQELGEWTAHADQARRFDHSPEAILFACKHELREAEVFWDFGDPRYDFAFPAGPTAPPYREPYRAPL